MEATVLKWHKNVGDQVRLDETLLDIATDKVDSEVPSTAEGILEEILCKENDVIAIGAIIAKIRTRSTEGLESAIPAIEEKPTFTAIETHKELESQIEVKLL